MNRFRIHAGCCLVSMLVAVLIGCRGSSARSSAGPTDHALIKVTLQADWYPQPEHGGFYTALAKGYYEREGLDLTIQPGGPYVVVPQQVAAGSAQFGMASSDQILESVAAGQRLVAVAATMQADPQGIMVRKNSPIHSFADLNGHTVAVKLGSTWWEYVEKRYTLDKVREIPATFSVANFIRDPQYIQQAFATSEPFFAHQAGIETRVLLTRDAGYNPYRVMFTTSDFLREHPDVVNKFVQASLEGWQDYLNSPEAAHTAIARLNPALNSEWMMFSWHALRDGNFVTGPDASGLQLGKMEPGRWTTMYQQLKDLQIISQSFDPASAYTLQFVQKR